MNKDSLPVEAWKTWQEFNRVVLGKKVIFFGVSDDWAEKTIKKGVMELAYFVDNSPTWIGSSFMGIEVKDPNSLDKFRGGEIYVVITSGSYESIYPQLLEYGLKPGADFCVSPAMNNLKVVSDVHMHEALLLISSPDHKIYSNLDKDEEIGGGLFTYNIKTQKCKKVLDGTFHQIVDTGKEYYVADEKRGACRISKDFRMLETFGIEAGDKSHGIAFCPQRRLVFIAKTGRDMISAYDTSTKKKCFDINLSDKFNKTGKPGHWINDICVRDDYLYASLFSHSGTYTEGIYDGGILQIEIENHEKRQILIRDLWMPHTVRFFDSEICFLDSMNGYFYKTDKNISGEFFGFIRGLAYDGSYYYIGQSETRYFDRLKGIRKNIGMSAGFYLFDEETKAAKFFVVPKVRQVRDLCIIN